MSDERRGGFRERRGGFRPSGPREMHKATCADCGKETEVPFKPSGDRPVYCQECFQKHKPKRY
ncbi:MAG: CxxC-x17-CxxC domain-containing protein [Candidatus Methanoperedens sp.]